MHNGNQNKTSEYLIKIRLKNHLYKSFFDWICSNYEVLSFKKINKNG